MKNLSLQVCSLSVLRGWWLCVPQYHGQPLISHLVLGMGVETCLLTFSPAYPPPPTHILFKSQDLLNCSVQNPPASPVFSVPCRAHTTPCPTWLDLAFLSGVTLL